MNLRLVALGLTLLVLTGCASQTKKAVGGLDWTHPRYATDQCQEAIAKTNYQEQSKLTRMIVTPLVMVLSGGSLALPMAATNVGMDTHDHLQAADVLESCSDKAKSARDISAEVAVGAGITLIGGALTGAGLSGTK